MPSAALHSAILRLFESDLGARPPWRVRVLRHGDLPNFRSRPLNSAIPGLIASVPEFPTIHPPALLDAVAKGEERAVEWCFKIYGPLVWTIVRRRVKDLSAAEDVAQEIFTEVWKSAGRHDPKISSEGGFIAMIARRRAIDWVRRQQRQPPLESLSPGDCIAADVAPPGAALDRESLWTALSTLSAETRRLFVLHFEKGMTHGDIAEATGLPLGSVKTRLRRGLIEAREIMRSVGESPNPGLHPEP